MLAPAISSLKQLLLPAHCLECGRPYPPAARHPLCDACSRALARLIEAPYCPRCGRHAGPYSADSGGCLFCRHYPIKHDATVRVGDYKEPLRGLLLRCKYQRRPDLAPTLGRLLAERLAATDWGDLVDLVVPVPLHWMRRCRRGFNQAELLARVLAAGAGGRRVARRKLLRVRATPHQRLLPAEDRKKNVRGAFILRPRAAKEIAGRRILLVDDIMTSGSTVAECTRVLREAGAAAVYVAVVATADFDEPGPW
jgi:ComF family protein